MTVMSARVGVRELRQHLSVYLRRVQSGEEVEVTERGKPVARLVPLRDDSTALERLVRSGRARPAEGHLRELGLPAGPPSDALSRALAQEREERL
jgi:prevent-host-death family protein